MRSQICWRHKVSITDWTFIVQDSDSTAIMTSKLNLACEMLETKLYRMIFKVNLEVIPRKCTCIRMFKWSMDFESLGGLWLVNQGVYIESCILSTPQWARLRTRRISFKLCWWPQIKTEPLYTSHNAEQIAMPLRNFHSYPPQSPNVYYKAGIHGLMEPIFSKSWWYRRPVRPDIFKMLWAWYGSRISKLFWSLSRPVLIRGSLLQNNIE